ncbi:hypothetical protein BDV19DRAFT_359041 [Aspergillus venezuelensis]
MNTLAALLLLSVLSLTNAIELTCNNEDKTNCIKAVNKGTHSFSFGDLFPENATFVYAMDPLTAVGNEELDNKDGLQKIAFWLEYSSLHADKTALEISHVGMLFTNASDSIGGGNNGCNGLLSEACAESLKDALKWGILSHLHQEQNQSLPNTLRGLHSSPLTNLSCPTDLFDDEALITTWNSTSGDVARPFLVETTANATMYSYPLAYQHLPSGSASQTYSLPVTKERSYEAQLAKAGVGIIVRAPIYIEPVYDWQLKDYAGERNVTFDEIQMDLVCMRLDGDGGDGNSSDSNSQGAEAGGSGDTGDNAASRTSMFIFPTLAGLLAALLL